MIVKAHAGHGSKEADMQVTRKVRMQHTDPSGIGECDPLWTGRRDLDRMEVIKPDGIAPDKPGRWPR